MNFKRESIYLTILVAIALGLFFNSQTQADSWEFVDILGNQVTPLKNEKTKGIVIVFISHECPVANGYQPALRELTKEFSSKGFSFIQVHPDPDITAEVAKKHATDYEIHGSVVIDSSQAIAKSVKAKITPEAFVISSKGEILYRGRIDNSWAKFGKRRVDGLSYDLKNAIADVLAGKPVRVKETKPLGCHIFYE